MLQNRMALYFYAPAIFNGGIYSINLVRTYKQVRISHMYMYENLVSVRYLIEYNGVLDSYFIYR